MNSFNAIGVFITNCLHIYARKSFVSFIYVNIYTVIVR